MCGIVAYIGQQNASRIILDGLKKLEYRGYDSAGLAVLQHNGHLAVRRAAGKLSRLETLMLTEPVVGPIGIGHTRWATHGEPSQRNAHPHTSQHGKIVLVHNGIVENFAELRQTLLAEGFTFTSDTDSEVIAQWMERYLEVGYSFEEAARHTLRQLKGSNAVVMLSAMEPDTIICARLGNAGGITLGVGEGEMYIASDIPAILEHTRRMIFLENRQMALVTRTGYRVMSLDGEPAATAIHTISWDPVSAARGEFKHFMQKEIFEQPRALLDTLRGRAHFEQGRLTLPELNLTPELAQRLHKLHIVACGTSYYAGLVGKFLIERIARLPVEVAYASEFRYYDPLLDDHTAILAITQSGETADTLAAMEQGRQAGATLWSIVNVMGSQAMRLADGYIAMHAGPEIGVASTKAFTTSIVDQYLLACALGAARGVLSEADLARYLDDVAHLPHLAGRLLDRDADYQALATHFAKAANFLFIGRGINYPVALEGALKLKEISYIHAEGYPAGEMKHGPIALIDENMPVLAIVTQGPLYDKMISQVQQARARGGQVIALATEGDEAIRAEVDHVIYVPTVPDLLQPVVNVMPLQLLAYHIAERLGCDVDQPRNLAKSVTVE